MQMQSFNDSNMKQILTCGAPILLCSILSSAGQPANTPNIISNMSIDPSTTLWYEGPAKAWEEALPVGNGRLGAMMFGKHAEERIQLNEETYWSGGPYSTVVKGGHKSLPEIQRMIFEGNPIGAHKLFGRELMGYPVEQQKYQSIGNLHLFFAEEEEVTGYRRWLDLNSKRLPRVEMSRSMMSK
jgi:alpha-L-fucosidase 2